MLPTMQVLVEDVMYVFKGGIPMSVWGSEYQLICAWPLSLPIGLINQ